MSTEPVDRESIHHELDQALAVFHDLLNHADPQDLSRGTDGTRWTTNSCSFPCSSAT